MFDSYRERFARDIFNNQVRVSTAWGATFEAWAALTVGETSRGAACEAYPVIWSGGGRDGGSGDMGWAALRAHVRRGAGPPRSSSVRLRLAQRGEVMYGACDVVLGVAWVARDDGHKRARAACGSCCSSCRRRRGGSSGNISRRWVRDKDAPLAGQRGVWCVHVGGGDVYEDGGAPRRQPAVPAAGDGLNFAACRAGDVLTATFDGATRVLRVEALGRGGVIYVSAAIPPPQSASADGWAASGDESDNMDADVRFFVQMGAGFGVEFLDVDCEDADAGAWRPPRQV